MSDALRTEIERETRENTVLVYSKGTDEVPRCGFTMETKQFFEQFGIQAKFIDVLDLPEKRDVLSELTDWPTLPKIFIKGKFYGDTDILEPMAQKGELQQVLSDAGIAVVKA